MASTDSLLVSKSCSAGSKTYATNSPHSTLQTRNKAIKIFNPPEQRSGIGITPYEEHRKSKENKSGYSTAKFLNSVGKGVYNFFDNMVKFAKERPVEATLTAGAAIGLMAVAVVNPVVGGVALGVLAEKTILGTMLVGLVMNGASTCENISKLNNSKSPDEYYKNVEKVSGNFFELGLDLIPLGAKGITMVSDSNTLSKLGSIGSKIENSKAWNTLVKMSDGIDEFIDCRPGVDNTKLPPLAQATSMAISFTDTTEDYQDIATAMSYSVSNKRKK